jgi:iron complex transport system substrate-binding protein
MTRALRCLAVTLVTAVALGACAASPATPAGPGSALDATPLSELTPVPDPRAYEGPSTATLVHHEVRPVADHPRQALPATVVSHDRGGDVDVVVKDTSRVLAINMSGSLASTVWGLGLGDSLVGRDVSTKIPGTGKLPVVTGDGHSINAESVLALDPSLVITDGTIGPRDVVEQLRDAGVKVVFVHNDPSFAGAARLARDVAAIYGVPQTGARLAKQINRQISSTKADIERLVPGSKARRLSMIFLYLRGGSGVYYLFGRESGSSDLIDGLGGIDVAEQMGWTGMRPMTDEAILKADPDLVLVMTDGIKSTGGIDGLLKAKPAIGLTKAGQHRRFVDMADGDILSFGPRSADVLAALARAVYAPDPA